MRSGFDALERGGGAASDEITRRYSGGRRRSGRAEQRGGIAAGGGEAEERNNAATGSRNHTRRSGERGRIRTEGISCRKPVLRRNTRGEKRSV